MGKILYIKKEIAFTKLKLQTFSKLKVRANASKCTNEAYLKVFNLPCPEGGLVLGVYPGAS